MVELLFIALYGVVTVVVDIGQDAGHGVVELLCVEVGSHCERAPRGFVRIT